MLWACRPYAASSTSRGSAPALPRRSRPRKGPRSRPAPVGWSVTDSAAFPSEGVWWIANRRTPDAQPPGIDRTGGLLGTPEATCRGPFRCQTTIHLAHPVALASVTLSPGVIPMNGPTRWDSSAAVPSTSAPARNAAAMTAFTCALDATAERLSAAAAVSTASRTTCAASRTARSSAGLGPETARGPR